MLQWMWKVCLRGAGVLADVLLYVHQVALWLFFFCVCGGRVRYEPDPFSCMVAVSTNGLGHVTQLLRLLPVVVKHSRIRVSVIVLGDTSKVPAYILQQIRDAFPGTEVVDLNFEMTYDEGVCINNSQVVWEVYSKWVFCGRRVARLITSMLLKHRPGRLLSFWEPVVTTIWGSLGCPSYVVNVASQGQLYAEHDETDLLLPLLYRSNVGFKGVLVPFSMSPMAGAIPQVIKLPPMVPAEDFFVAYSVMPGVLLPIIRFTRRKIVLFVKKPEEWQTQFGQCAHIELRPVSADFPTWLARSRGLLGSPSRGSVMQAVAAGKPVYLFLPQGHLEQRFNLRCYLTRFEGVGTPQVMSMEQWDDRIPGWDLREQALRTRAWINCMDQRIKEVVIPNIERGLPPVTAVLSSPTSRP